MNVNIIISMVGLLAIALLAATYFRTFGLRARLRMALPRFS